MKFLPFENIIYHTKLSADEVLKRLSDNVEQRKVLPFGFYSSGKIYGGNIKQNSFKISRIRHTTSTMVIINGKFYKDDSGTTIEIKMSVNMIFSVFMIICSIAVFVWLLVGLIGNDLLFVFIPFIMLLFFYSLTTITFKLESIEPKKHIVELFEAEIKTS